MAALGAGAGREVNRCDLDPLVGSAGAGLPAQILPGQACFTALDAGWQGAAYPGTLGRTLGHEVGGDASTKAKHGQTHIRSVNSTVMGSTPTPYPRGEIGKGRAECRRPMPAAGREIDRRAAI